MRPELILLYFEPVIIIGLFQRYFIRTKSDRNHDIKRRYSNKCFILKFNYNLRFYVPLLIFGFIVNFIFSLHIVVNISLIQSLFFILLLINSTYFLIKFQQRYQRREE